MSKMAYNVNKTVKTIDVNKQFSGGLKTVDTDDALGAFYLRDAENVALSEYGFLEKRYGIVEDLTFDFDLTVLANDYIQGYFEYSYTVALVAKVDKILFMTGKLYLKRDGGSWAQVTTLTEFTDGTLYASETAAGVASMSTLGFSIAGSTWTFSNPFTTNEDIEATRIEDTLYMFTGIYPITYTSDGIFRPLAEFLPDFTELKIFNHNIHNANNAGYYNEVKVTTGGAVAGDTTDKGMSIIDYSYYPTLPYLDDTADSIFNISCKFNYPDRNPYKSNFLYFSTWPVGVLKFVAAGYNDLIAGDGFGPGAYVFLTPRVYYRTSGIGASELEWTEIAEANIIHQTRNNMNATAIGHQESFWKVDGSVPTEILANRERDFELISTDAYTIGVKTIPEGTLDIKVTLETKLAGYRLSDTVVDTTVVGFDLDSLNFTVNIMDSVDFVIKDVHFTKEQLLDYEDINATDLWSCNKVLNHYGKLMAYGSTTNPERVFVGHPTFKEYFPEYFTLDFETDIDESIQKITPFMNILVVQSESYTWGLKGVDALVDAQNPYSQFTINPIYGTIAPKSVRPVRNQLYFLSKEGLVALKSLYATDDQYNIKPIDKNIRNIVPLDTDAVGIQYDDQYWINFPNSPDNMTLRYYIDKQAWVKDTYFEYNGLDENGVPVESSSVFNGVHKFVRRDGELTAITNPMYLASDAIYDFYKLEYDYSIPTDLGEIPRTTFETSFLNQGFPFHIKKYLETKFDFTIQNEYNNSTAPIFLEEGVDASAGTYTLLNVELKENHDYIITNSAINAGQITNYPQYGYMEHVTNAVITYFTVAGVQVGTTHAITAVDTSDPTDGILNKLSFTARNVDFGYAEILLTFDAAFAEYDDIDVLVRDNTYDSSLNFSTLISSEERPLNLNPEDYGNTYGIVGIELGSSFGSWAFGTDTFGNKVTIVKTVKLSGKGYNIKIIFVDFSKSKWTLETVGTTYKMKKVRS